MGEPMTIDDVRARLEAGRYAHNEDALWADLRALLDDHARLAAEVARLAAALAGYEGKPCGRRDCASARADAREEVERLTRERDAARADLASALGEYRDGIEAERDRLAAALAEVREAVVELYAADNAAQDEQDFRGHVGKANGRRFDAAHANLRRIVDATPADLAAAHDAKIAESVRERCARLVDWHADHDADLSALADAMRSMPLDEAERIERGGR